MQDEPSQDWPGKKDGVPRPPTPAELDEISNQQGMITDEWTPEPAPDPTPGKDCP